MMKKRSEMDWLNLLTCLWSVSCLFTVTWLYEFAHQSNDIFTFSRRVLYAKTKENGISIGCQLQIGIHLYSCCGIVLSFDGRVKMPQIKFTNTARLTDRFVNFATKTYSTPSVCCCTSNVSNTLSRMFPFFANKSEVPFKYSMSSR